MKSLILYLIKKYQKYAPARIRRSCRFEPSCSNYMILALDKYGVLLGLRKGIGRLGRCKPPYGGVDIP
jgi:putative membrane protein insertion efficiency factor